MFEEIEKPQCRYLGICGFFLILYYHKYPEKSRLVSFLRQYYTMFYDNCRCAAIKKCKRGAHMSMENWMEQMNGRMWLEQVRETNQYTEKYGLTLTPEDTEILQAEKNQILKKERRVEFGESLLPRIIYTFCDSSYISQDEYVDTLVRLQEIFYLYKNEMQDEITDEELLNFMKEQFETVCFGDLQYLEGTCLDLFAQAIRAGYGGYSETQGRGEFSRFDIVQRWDKELYLLALSQING